MMYPYQLEKGANKFTCPSCGTAKKFRRVIELATGQYLPDYVGVCDRSNSCGYEYTWKQYLADNPTLQNVRKMSVSSRIAKHGSLNKNGSQAFAEARLLTKTPDFIPNDRLLESLSNYERNAFVQFLLGLFPNDAGDVWQAVREYLISTGPDGKTIFWQIDQKQRIRTGKAFVYDRATGKRIKRIKPFFVHPKGFNLEQCFFGEHLLAKYPGRPVAFVESEKTAILGSICKGVFTTDLIWLACGGKSNFKAESLKRLGRDRKILIYPDADGFEKWQAIASEARSKGLTVQVSDLIERLAKDAEKANGWDLADYLIREQMAINDHNGQTPGDLETIRQERIGIMMFDGLLNEADATRIATEEVGRSWQ